MNSNLSQTESLWSVFLGEVFRWRKNKTRSSESMPEEIWELARCLVVAGVDVEDVCRVSGLNLKKLLRKLPGEKDGPESDYQGTWNQLGPAGGRAQVIPLFRDKVSVPQFTQHELFERSQEQQDLELLSEVKRKLKEEGLFFRSFCGLYFHDKQGYQEPNSIRQP